MKKLDTFLKAVGSGVFVIALLSTVFASSAEVQFKYRWSLLAVVMLASLLGYAILWAASKFKKTDSQLPTITQLESFPPNCNPFNYDPFNMGSEVSGPWMAMYREHSGLKQRHNMTEDERQRADLGEPIYNPDPQYIIFINTKTGFRFRLDWLTK